MGDLVLYQPEPAASSLPARLERTDQTILKLWLEGKAAHTQEAYAADARRLFSFVGRPLNQMVLEDLQSFATELVDLHLSPGSRKRILASIKSLFTFAAEVRYLPFNVAAALKLPRPKETLNERILSEGQVQALIAAAGEDGSRNRAIVELLYLVGLRAEELATLCWRDARPDSGGAVLTVFGKGDKTRHVHLEADTWGMLLAWRGSSANEEPIFRSRAGGALSTVQIWRIVSSASRRAGLSASPHWLRHAHATHAIDHGCDLRTLQQSLGHASSMTTERYIHCRPKKSSGGFLRRPA